MVLTSFGILGARYASAHNKINRPTFNKLFGYYTLFESGRFYGDRILLTFIKPIQTKAYAIFCYLLCFEILIYNNCFVYFHVVIFIYFLEFFVLNIGYFFFISCLLCKYVIVNSFKTPQIDGDRKKYVFKFKLFNELFIIFTIHIK